MSVVCIIAPREYIREEIYRIVFDGSLIWFRTSSILRDIYADTPRVCRLCAVIIPRTAFVTATSLMHYYIVSRAGHIGSSGLARVPRWQLSFIFQRISPLPASSIMETFGKQKNRCTMAGCLFGLSELNNASLHYYLRRAFGLCVYIIMYRICRTAHRDAPLPLPATFSRFHLDASPAVVHLLSRGHAGRARAAIVKSGWQ